MEHVSNGEDRVLLGPNSQCSAYSTVCCIRMQLRPRRLVLVGRVGDCDFVPTGGQRHPLHQLGGFSMLHRGQRPQEPLRGKVLVSARTLLIS